VIALAPALFELGEPMDHIFHERVAFTWYTTGQPSVALPHPVYHLLWMFLNGILGGLNLALPGLTIYLACYALVGMLSYRLVTEQLAPVLKGWQCWLVALLIALIQFAAPIALFTLGEQNLYLGYIHISTYHNPTTILLRPLALIQFLFVLQFLRSNPPGIPTLIGLTVLSLIAAYAKPSYALTLLPMLFVLICVRALRRQSLQWGIPLALGLPSAVALVWQTLVVSDTRGGIGFDPFSVLLMYSPDVGTVLLKIVMSSLFPLAIVLLFPRRALDDSAIVLGWGIYLIAVTQVILLTETYQADAGNFFWGPYIALLILFIVSLRLLVEVLLTQRENAVSRLARAGAVSVILLVHMGFGVFWWLLHLVSIWGGAGLIKVIWW
jgi:hypothetical protein